MDNRHAMTAMWALGEAAAHALLRGAAMVLATLVVLGALAGAAFISSVIEAAQPEATTQDILLMPANDPGTTM